MNKVLGAILVAVFVATFSWAADSDQYGIPDHEDSWPNDGAKPVVSQLWGVGGELWTSDSRLPFVGFAGYRDSSEPPVVTRVVANVAAFGATGTDGSADDTQAFLDAIAHAETQVSASNHGAILVPAGVYDVTTNLVLTTSGMVLQGEGRDVSEIRFTYTGDAKGVVMGSGGCNWQHNQHVSTFSCKLDTAQMPQLGDFTLHLASPMTQAFKDDLAAQGNRARIAQWINRAYNGTTPQLVENIYGGILKPEATGHSSLAQEFNVTVINDSTLKMDRPLRWTPTTEMLWNQPVLVSLRDTSATETQEIGVEDLTVRFQAPSFVPHNGIGENGINVNADHSWVRGVRIVNSDHSIWTESSRSHVTISDIIVEADRGGSYYGPGQPWFYRVYGHVGIGVNGYDHLVRGFVLNNTYIHDVSMRHSQGCVVMSGQGVEMAMDHHRQTIYANVWTEIDVGIPHRMWNSTGDAPEGYQCGAYNTWWNITSDDPSVANWPDDGNWMHWGTNMWGHFVINLVGTDLTNKPPVGGIPRSTIYNPTNVHLEAIAQNELWPQNIYLAQREAYVEGRLWAPPVPVADPVSTNLLEDTSVGITLTGSDDNGDTLFFSVDTLPDNGVLSGTAPNLIYTPDTNFFGADSFTFTVSDGSTTSAAATVSITVNAVNDDPVFSVDPIIGNMATQGVAYVGSIIATDVDGDLLTYSLTGIPAWLTVSTNGVLGGTPGAGDTGLSSFTVEVDDGNGGTDTATLEIGVAAVTGTQTTAVLEKWEFNEAADTAYGGWGNSGSVGTPWSNYINPAAATTDGNGNLELKEGAGIYSTTPAFAAALSGSDTYSWEVEIGEWSTEAGKSPAQSNWRLSTASQIDIQVKLNADNGLGVQFVCANSNYRTHWTGALIGSNAVARIDFNIAEGWATYYLNDVEKNHFTGLTFGTLDKVLLQTVGLNAVEGGRTLNIDEVSLSVERYEADVDSDGDGLTDAQEIALGTDPDDPDSGFGIDGLPLPTIGKIQIAWPSSIGVLYKVWESPDLSSWTVARDWTNALTPPQDALEINLTLSNGFFKIEAEIQ